MVTNRGARNDDSRTACAPEPAAKRRRCSCGEAHRCDGALDAIQMPEEDSRLYARAHVDFGQVPVGDVFTAAIAGNFNIRIHVPRALQQQITGNGFVGSVLGSARISADISERVGSVRPAQCGGTEVCLFVDFHEQRRGQWMVDLRVLGGSHLRVPVRVDAALGTKPDMVLPTGVVPVALELAEDVLATCGPIVILSGSVADLWRSIRDRVRDLLAQHIEGVARQELARIRTALRDSLRSQQDQGALDREAMERQMGRMLLLCLTP